MNGPTLAGAQLLDEVRQLSQHGGVHVGDELDGSSSGDTNLHLTMASEKLQITLLHVLDVHI